MRGPRLPDNFDIVLTEYPVGTHEWNSVVLSLHDNNSVERVAVVKWQVGNPGTLRDCERKRSYGCRVHLLANQAVEISNDIEPAQTVFDRKLPDTSHTQ